MEKGERFIRMTDCPEIQEGHKPTSGDWYTAQLRNGEKPELVCLGDLHFRGDYDLSGEQWDDEAYPVTKGCGCCEDRVALIQWVPSEAQIKHMVITNPLVMAKIGYRPSENAHRFLWRRVIRWLDKSEAEAWLCFLMYHQYGKVWAGNTWELEGTKLKEV